ncbi:MAG: hypothetical protein KBB86_03290 [Candidatus Pacebacteria bacterium]|nr:hypothetical protein [Candidatus Paceibacterota bacterium]
MQDDQQKNQNSIKAEPTYLCYNGPIGNGDKHNHLKVKIGISGAAETGTCGLHALDIAKELGRQVIMQGGILITGATSGFPLWTSMGAKEMSGVVIGLSPALNAIEHVNNYKLPLEFTDLIIYTGFGFAGRDILFARSTDAMIFGCGRIGTIHEFTIAYEDGKPIGILDGGWSTDETIRDILSNSGRSSDMIVFEKDPAILVQKMLALVAEGRVAKR